MNQQLKEAEITADNIHDFYGRKFMAIGNKTLELTLEQCISDDDNVKISYKVNGQRNVTMYEKQDAARLFRIKTWNLL